MLRKFVAHNYKAFKDKLCLSLIPDETITGEPWEIQDWSLVQQKAKDSTVKSLSSSIIIGPNAAGKSTILEAIDTLRQFVCRGYVADLHVAAYCSDKPEGYRLSFIPNLLNEHPKPVKFCIDFVTQGYEIEYSLSVDLGEFSPAKHDHRIVSEELFVDKAMLFTRTDKGISLGSSPLGTTNELPADFVESTQLLLNRQFASLVNFKVYQAIFEWFDTKLDVILDVDALSIPDNYGGEVPEGHFNIQSILSDGIKAIGGRNLFGYARDKGQDSVHPSSAVLKPNGSSFAVPVTIFESKGVQRFLKLFPHVVSAIVYGRILLVDDMDISLHFRGVSEILSIFHNDEVNVHGGQLILTSHNPMMLNPRLMRMDEIKFVEYDDEEHSSRIYSLSDFSKETLKEEMKDPEITSAPWLLGYALDRFGAIPDTDIYSVFDSIKDLYIKKSEPAASISADNKEG